MDIIKTIDGYLNEGDLTRKERSEITSAIIKNKSLNIKLKDFGTDAKIDQKDDETVIIFKSDDDLTMSLVDICDLIGLKFTSKESKGKTVFTIKK